MRRKRRSFSPGFQDPGKDLFAFLFLTTFIMVFVMIISYEQKSKGGRKAPAQRGAGAGTITMSQNNVGRLARENASLVLVYENRRFDPTNESDVKELLKGKRVQEKNGEKEIYIVEDPQCGMLVTEYFHAFEKIKKRGINVVFGKMR
jgi:hypothetical protein